MTLKINYMFGYFTFLEFYLVLFSLLPLLKAMKLCVTVLLLYHIMLSNMHLFVLEELSYEL